MDFLAMGEKDVDAAAMLYIHRQLAKGVSAYHIAEHFRGLVSTAVDEQLSAEWRATDITIAMIESGEIDENGEYVGKGTGDNVPEVRE